MKIHIAITTYNRGDELQKLIDSIYLNRGAHELDIHIYDDFSDHRFTINSPFEINYFQFPRNNGKKGYWRVIDRAFQDASQKQFDYFFLLQDDCTLVDSFFDRAIEQWENIGDKRKGTYCTFTPSNVYQRIMWGGRAKDVQYNHQAYIQGDYVDCIFMCPRRTLERLSFQVNAIAEDFWEKDPNKSSGVGMQLTRRLKGLRMGMYTAYDSLILTGESKSLMNPEERKKNPLKPLVREAFHVAPKTYSRDIYAGIASIPTRSDALYLTLRSLEHQIDKIFVALNGYTRLPDYAKDFNNVEFMLTSNDLGDANKFLKVTEVSGYFFTCDDDIVYPEDYVEKMVLKLEKYEPAIVTCHARSVYKKPINSFYHDTEQYHFLFRQREDIRSHIPGTGVCAFHTDNVKIPMHYFEKPNMADIWLGKYAQENNIPVICVGRKQRWLNATKIHHDKSIYHTSRGNDKIQVKTINENIWCELQ